MLLGGAALIVAALTLLIPSTPSYDPWAWLVWGREIVHLDLHTTGGPTWKPLPVIFTTVFALFGKAQPDLWLVIARAGFLLAVALAFRIAWRLVKLLGTRAEGIDPVPALAPALLAGAIAAICLGLSDGFLSDSALGYSEGLLVAAVLIALDRHLDGKYRQAFALGFVAALDRPEVWLFWGPYGLWLWRKDPGARKLVGGLFVLIPILWFLPEYWGSGHFLRGVSRAQHPRANSAAWARIPFLAELKQAWPTVRDRIKVITAVTVLVAGANLWRAVRARGDRRLRDPHERALALIALAGLVGAFWWILIAALTQAGFSGNNRYLVLGAALMEIAAAVGYGWAALGLGAIARRRLDPDRLRGPAASWASAAVLALAFAVVPGWVGSSLINFPRTHRSLIYQAHLREDMSRAVAELGGPAKVLGCGAVMTEGFQVPMLAWTLDVRTLRVEAPPGSLVSSGPWPSTILQTRDTSNATLLPTPAQILAWEHEGARYRFFRVHTIFVFSTCAGKVRR